MKIDANLKKQLKSEGYLPSRDGEHVAVRIITENGKELYFFTKKTDSRFCFRSSSQKRRSTPADAPLQAITTRLNLLIQSVLY